MPCDDCSRTEKCPPCPHEEPKVPEPSSTECTRCGHTHKRNTHTCGWRYTDASSCECKGPKLSDCTVQHHTHTGGPTDRRLDTCRYGEPPMTPEEEEEAPEDGRCAHESWDVTGEWGERDANGGTTGKWWKSRRCNDCGEDLDNVLEDEPHWDFQPVEPPPPQPVRRPPYAVLYSVQGHLYEVALPGDATVQAMDGALVIQHHLGPVAGICQVLPVINEESA